MSSPNLERLWEEVRMLSPEEQRELRERLHAPAAAPGAMSEEEFEQELLRRGMICQIPAPITDFTPYEDWKPIEIKGKPLSETVIEERR